MATNYLTKKQFSQAKARLTRALNVARKTKTAEAWQRVIDVVDSTYAEWDRGNYAWPDDWHRWNIARGDAEVALRWAT